MPFIVLDFILLKQIMLLQPLLFEKHFVPCKRLEDYKTVQCVNLNRQRIVKNLVNSEILCVKGRACCYR